MRAKPDMKPWGYTDKKRNELRRSGTITRAFVLRLGSAAPVRGSINVSNNEPRACALGYAGVSP